MLTIRDAQMKVLMDHASRQAALRMARALRAACPAESAALPEEQLLGEVRDGMAHAARYGIEAERDLLPFLECRLTFGPAFEERPELAWMAEVLRDDSLFAGEKADLLADRDLALGAGGSGK